MEQSCLDGFLRKVDKDNARPLQPGETIRKWRFDAFLGVLPTSAPSERVWSGFGHVITKNSSTIDSTLSAKIMFLCHNKDMLPFII